MDLGHLKARFLETLAKLDQNSAGLARDIDQGLRDVGAALEALQSTSGDQRTIVEELTTRLGRDFSKITEISDDAPEGHEGPDGGGGGGGGHRDVDFGLDRCAMIVDGHFKQDISVAYWPYGFLGAATIDCCVAYHLYHQGLFEVGDSFLREAQLPEDAADTAAAAAAAVNTRSTFYEVHGNILAPFWSGDLEPAVAWAAAHCEDVMPRLRALEFLSMLQGPPPCPMDVLLDYVEGYLAPSARWWKAAEFEPLMGCLAFPGRLDQSPYSQVPTEMRSRVAGELFKQFCRPFGHPHRSPLNVVATAGAQVLPRQLDMAEELASTWQTMKVFELPESLSDVFSLHSVFVCPVTCERATRWNPPVMLVRCGHVICQRAVAGILKDRPMTESIACPFCKEPATFEDRKAIRF